MLAVCNSWLKGCGIDYSLPPRSWENCSLYSVITSHTSADHSFSAVIDILEANQKRSNLMKSASYQTAKCTSTGLCTLSQIYRGTPFPLKIRPLISAVCGKSSHLSLCSHWKKNQANDAALTWHCNTYSQPNIQQLWWFTVTLERKVGCSLETVSVRHLHLHQSVGR